MSQLNSGLIDGGSGEGESSDWKDFGDTVVDFEDEFDENWEEKDDMDRKPVTGGTEVIATMTQKNNGDFPIAYASSIDLDNGDNLQQVITDMKAKAADALTEAEIDQIWNEISK